MKYSPRSETKTLTARFNMTMRPEERAKLQALADRAGLNEAKTLRMLITQTYAAKFGRRRPPNFKPKPNSKARGAGS